MRAVVLNFRVPQNYLEGFATDCSLLPFLRADAVGLGQGDLRIHTSNKKPGARAVNQDTH